MKKTNIVSGSGENTRKGILLAIILGIAASGAGLAVVYAIAYVASLSDTVSVNDKPSLRTAAKDTIPVGDVPNSNNKITDNLNPAENVGNNNHIITDGLNPGDDPASATRNIDTIDVSDSGALPYALSTADFVSISDTPAYSPVLGDMMSASDSLAMSIEARERHGHRAAPNRTVYEEFLEKNLYDESFLEKNPLLRMKILSLDIFDEYGSANTQIKAGEPFRIAAIVGNFQESDQAYIVITQITDNDNYTVQILFSYGTTKSGNAADIVQSWLAEHNGNYSMKIMVWTNLENPIPLAEPATKDFLIQ